MTTLPNGIRVASENTPGHFGAVGVYMDAGSRYETEKTRGVSHILDRLAFKVHFEEATTMGWGKCSICIHIYVI